MIYGTAIGKLLYTWLFRVIRGACFGLTVLFLLQAATMANSDDFTLDDHFVSSAANKISPAQLEERERQKAIRGIFVTVNPMTI